MTRARQRGSVLMLMPAGALVVILLGAVSFDLSLLFLRQRQAASIAVDVANDLASVAFDEEVFRRDGTFQLDPDRAVDIGTSLIDASDLRGRIEDVEITITGPDQVQVRITARVDYVFAKAIPGAADGTTVTGRATAVARAG